MADQANNSVSIPQTQEMIAVANQSQLSYQNNEEEARLLAPNGEHNISVSKESSENTNNSSNLYPTHEVTRGDDNSGDIILKNF